MIGLEAFIAVFMATVVLVLKPGPYVITISSLAGGGHWPKVVSFLLGGYTGGTIIYFVLLTSMSVIAQFDVGFIFFMLKSFAAAWLIWLGVQGLLKEEAAINDLEARKEKFTARSFFENFGAGFLLTSSNPYDILFITGVIPSLVGQSLFTITEIASIRGTVILADILTLMVYIVPVVMIKRHLDLTCLKVIRVLTSIFLIGVGFYIGYTALIADDLLQAGVL